MEAGIQDYVGEVRHGERHGQGTATWSDGKRYVGEWKKGQRHGQGSVTWSNGELFVGTWNNDQATGQGTFTWPNGSQYVGEYLNSMRHGKGTMTWPNGAKYFGEWKDDAPGGKGVQSSSTGKQHSGEFKVSFRHGRGIEYWPEGVADPNTTYYWENGEIILQSEWFRRDRERKFQELAREIGLSSDENADLSIKEKIYIIAVTTDDDEILEAPGFASRWVDARIDISESLIKTKTQSVFLTDAMETVLSHSTDELESFFDQHTLAGADRNRLLMWADWSKSAERKKIEAYFRSLPQE